MKNNQRELSISLAQALQVDQEKRGLQGRPIFGNYTVYESMGIRDQSRPTERQQRRDFRGVFFKCLEMRATSVSSALSDSFVERMVGQMEYAPVEFNHPWYKLLKNPSQIWSTSDLWEWASTSIDLTGHADFIVERDNRNMPFQLLPLYEEFGYLEIAPSAEGGIKHWVLYRSDGQIIPIARENVLRLDRKSPYSPYESYSLIEAARFELDTTNEMKRYRRASVQNGGIGSPVLTTDQDLNSTQHAQLTQTYKQFVGRRGVENGGVAVFGSGAKPWTPVSAKDLEYIQGEVQTKEDIMMICGVPKGLFESATTRATAEAAQVVFAEQTVSKLVNKYASQITHQFEYIFNADKGILYVRPPDVVPMDKDFELRRRQSYLSTGQRTINDYLLEDGFTTDTNGGKRYVPIGWTPIDVGSVDNDSGEGIIPTTDVEKTALNGAQIMALQQMVQAVADGQMPAATAIELILVAFPSINEATAKAIINPAANFTPAQVQDDGRFIRSHIVKQYRIHQKKSEARSRMTSEERTMLWRAVDKKKQRQANLMRPTVNEWFESLKADILSKVDDYTPERKFTQNVFDPLAAEYDFLERLAPEVLRAMRAGFINGMELAKITGLEFPMSSPYTQSTIRTVLATQTTVPQTLFTAIGDKIAEGMNAKLSRADMANLVRDFFEGYAPGKVDNIVNGLSTATWEAGQDLAYNEAGVTAREWLSSRDDKVRPTHDAADGQRVDLNSFFLVGGVELKHPADPNGTLEETIGCRCVTLPVIE